MIVKNVLRYKKNSGFKCQEKNKKWLIEKETYSRL